MSATGSQDGRVRWASPTTPKSLPFTRLPNGEMKSSVLPITSTKGKSMTDWRKKIEGEIVPDSADLLRYKAVKRALGVKSNGVVRKLVNDGKLIRVRVGPFSTQLRITQASLDAYLYELNE